MHKRGTFVRLSTFLLLMIVLGPGVLRTQTPYYVDSTMGDDTHNGRSPSSAWKTISKVNSVTLAAGDTVFFKRGQVWREQLTLRNSGSPGRPIVFTNYGNGPQPLINGSTLLSAGWVDDGHDVWKHPLVPSTPGSQDGGKLSNVFFNNVRGTEVGTIGELTKVGDWYYDQKDNLYVYSATDPATTFGNPGIEASDRYCIVPNGKSHIIIDGIDVTKANSGGIWASSKGSYLTVRNLTLSFNGMSAVYSDATNSSLINCTMRDNGVGRHDHGVYFKGDSSLVEKCHSYRNAGAGITFVDCSGTIRYNTCDSNGIVANYRNPALNGFGVTMVPGPGHTVNCYYNLLFDNYGHGVWASNRGTVRLYNNVIARTKHVSDAAGLVVTSSIGAIEAKNNIFYAQDAGCTDIYVVTSSARLVFDHNEYFGTSGTSISWMGTSYSTSRFSNFKSETGQEANGIVADPQFIDPNRNNFMPRPSSPAKDAGIHVGLDIDYVGNSVPVGPHVDIGALVIR